MVRRIAFIDGSGQTAFCHCVVLAGVVYEGSAGYLYAFAEYTETLKRRLGVTGELKWREVKRRGGVAVVEELERKAKTAWVRSTTKTR